MFDNKALSGEPCGIPNELLFVTISFSFLTVFLNSKGSQILWRPFLGLFKEMQSLLYKVSFSTCFEFLKTQTKATLHV